MYEYPYEPIPADSEILLSEEPTDLLKDHIRDQFKNPLAMRFDYVGTFIENYRYSILQIQDEDDKIEIDRICDDFITFLMNILTKYFEIGFPDLDNKTTEDQLDILHMTYRYFIINMKHNMSSFCMNYIEKHKDELIEDMPKKKDIMTVNLRQDLIDEDTIVIISNLYEIIKTILSGDHDVDNFLDHSDLNEPRLETEEMNEYFDNFSIVGNFVSSYTQLALQDPSIIKEIESKLRNKILKPFKKYFKKVVPCPENEVPVEEPAPEEESE